MKRLYIVVAVMILGAVIACGMFVYQSNKPVDSKTVYMLPEKSNKVGAHAEILAAKKPPEPQIRKPVEPETAEQIELEGAGLTDEELQEFLDLVRTATEEVEEEDEEAPFVLLDLTPDEMIEHMRDNYHPDNYMDFLTSGEGLRWVKTKLAPNYPRLDDPFVTECKDMYPRRGDGYTDCVEDRYRILVADNRDSYVNGTRNVLDFIEKLNPTPFGGGGASGSIAPAVKPPEPRIR